MTNTEDRYQILLNKALDGMLNSEEKIEFEKILATSKEYQQEWQSLKKIKEITKDMKFKNLPDEIWDKYWLGIYARLERGIAWILISIGAIILLIYGGFKAVESIITDPTLEWFIKAGIIAIITGISILLVSIVREKLKVSKTDKYKEIIR